MAAVSILSEAPATTSFGGQLLLTRTFLNPTTKESLTVNAYEVGDAASTDEYIGDLLPGQFAVIFSGPSNMVHPHDMEGSLHHVVEKMQSYTPPSGFTEVVAGEVPAGYL